MCQTEKADVSRVREALRDLRLPEQGTVWIGPYEQLHGAGYALLAAARHGVYGRDLSGYHAKVRAKVVSLILEHADNGVVTDKSAFDNAIAGFYFNCSIQRIVWASERLVSTFVSVKCKCRGTVEASAKNKKSHFSDIRRDAKRRVDHLISNGNPSLQATSDFLGLFMHKPYRREGPFDPDHSLAMLQYDVNNRKHAVYGPLVQDRKSTFRTTSAKPKKWSDASQGCQMHLACTAFNAVCRAYNELRNWHPNARA